MSAEGRRNANSAKLARQKRARHNSDAARFDLGWLRYIAESGVPPENLIRDDVWTGVW